MVDEGKHVSVGGGGSESVLEIDNNEINNGISKNSEDINNDNEVVIGTIKRKGNRNKRIECKVCFKIMQSNNVKWHMKQHPDLMIMDEDEVRLQKRFT